MIVVNFKRYPEADGDKAVLLAAICKKLSEEFKLPIIPVPQEKDLIACLALETDCWSQKFLSQGGHSGTLLNHSDFRLSTEQLKEELSLSRNRGEKVCICAETYDEVIANLLLTPDLLAYEPPELIGSKTSSVAKSQPEVIGKTADACLQMGIPLLVGAGIKSAEDVRVSLQRGAVGVLVASAVVQAADQEQALRELIHGFSMKA